MAEPLVLTYNLDTRTAAGIGALCRKQQIGFHPVRRDEYGLPIGALAGIPVSGPKSVPLPAGFDDPMLVMCHMLSSQLDAFLQGMRNEGIPRIGLKAVLTPANVAWDSCRLHDELARERAAISGR